MKQFASTIKQKYWDMKIDDVMENGYFWEYKNDFEFWSKRLNNLVTPCDGVLLIGNKPKRIGVIQVKRCITKNIQNKYSDGIITTTFCYAIKCIPMADEIPEFIKMEPLKPIFEIIINRVIFQVFKMSCVQLMGFKNITEKQYVLVPKCRVKYIGVNLLIERGSLLTQSEFEELSKGTGIMEE